MRYFVKVGIALAIMAAGAAPPAVADPVSVTYRVDITSQCRVSEGSSDIACRDFTSSFPLTVSFDSGVARDVSGSGYRYVYYGVPSVSDIPLPQRTDYPPLHVTNAYTADSATMNLNTGWRHGAEVYMRNYALIDHAEYYTDLRLSGEDFSSAMPQLDAKSFAVFLGTAASRRFFFGNSAELASGGFETLAYNGTFSLETAPTPEPASMILLGTGLGALAMRRRRQPR